MGAHVLMIFNIFFIEPLKYFGVLKTGIGMNVSACSSCILPRESSSWWHICEGTLRNQRGSSYNRLVLDYSYIYPFLLRQIIYK